MPLSPRQQLSIFLRQRHVLFAKTTITHQQILQLLGFLLLLSYFTQESTAYLNFNYCARRKSIQKCTLSYRIGKFLQKLGPLLHFFLASLFLPLSKKSVLAYTCGASFERTVGWHRFIGRWMLILLGAVHALGFMLKWLVEGRLYHKINKTANFWGAVAFFISLSMLYFSRDAFRRQHYFIFRTTHLVSAPLYILGVLWHHDGPDLWKYLALPFFFYVLDIVWRVWQTWQQSRKATVVAVHKVGPHMCRLTLSTGGIPVAIQPGQYINLMLPALSTIAPPKPYTILQSTSHLSLLDILIKDHGNRITSWTHRLVSMAGDDCPLIGTTAIIDGPYGRLSLPLPLAQYSNVLLIAGGIGATPLLALLECAPLFNIDGDDEKNRGKRRNNNWHFVWSLREATLLQECQRRLENCRAQCSIHVTGGGGGGGTSYVSGGTVAGGVHLPRRRDVEGVLVPSCGGGGGSIGDSGGSIDVKQGRPNLSEAVKTAACREGWTAVIVCGPPSMTLAVRNRVHLLQLESGNKVHLHEETFEL